MQRREYNYIKARDMKKNCQGFGAIRNCPQGFYNAISSSIKWSQESYFKQHPVLK